MANKHAYATALGSIWLLRLANLNHSHAMEAPIGWDKPPRRADQAMARQRDPIAMYKGNAMAKPSVMLWTKSAIKTLKPREGLAWLVAYVMNPSGNL